MKALILGSEGFIGGHIVSLFLKKGWAITGCDLVEIKRSDYTYFKVSIFSGDFTEIVSRESFDLCVNCSGSGNVGFSIEHPLSDFEANAYSVARVLDSIRKYNPSCKYIHISSAAVYGNPEHLPIYENIKLQPLSPYGYHKMISETICREYQELYKMPIAILRPFSVYGSGLRKQLLWDICNRLQKDKTIELFGTGNESRDFIQINDLSRLVELVAMKSPFKGNIYNAASGVETTIKRISELFIQYFPGAERIIFSGTQKKGDPLNWRADVSEIKQLGFDCSVSLEHGVRDYIHWFQQNNH